MRALPDRETYEDIWTTLINPQLERYKKCFDKCVYIDENAKEVIWEKYADLNVCCKTEYMTAPEGRLDRHKVAACYLIAIVYAKPIKFIKLPLMEDMYFVSNEKVAISTAMSIVRAYVLASCNELADSNEKESITQKFENGLRYPPKEYVHHGDYLDNFASEIYYVGRERKLHVLSVAHELYLLEVLTFITPPSLI